jgi:predicted TIM-barrel fold metal-dependent hydrolase
MIDAHIHVVPPRLPGVGSLNPLLDAGPDVVAGELRRQMQQAGIEHALAMGCWNPTEEDPLGTAATLETARLVPGLYAVGIADPTRTEPDHLRRVDAVLTARKVVALKGYLGYLHYGPDHPGYSPYYELAARHALPFIFHTGDTYSPRAKLRFSHPLAVDEVAVDHPKVRFVLAHLGNPWVIEGAEVVYKNVNVWADLSGLVVGDEVMLKSEERRDVLQDVAAQLGRAFRYAERPNRFLYGSDWPLVPMAGYRDFIQTIIPEVYHEQVFNDNARSLFRLE